MKKITLFLALASFMFSYGQNDTVTFSVDMSNYYATTFTNVYVNGTFNSWCGPCNPMSDANGDSIWEVSLPLTADTIEYKFTLDGWTGQETLDPALSCTTPATVNTNRYLIFTSDTVLPTVCWESCDTCGPLLQPVDLPITFDDSLVDYSFVDFGDNSSTITADPNNAANHVLKTIKTAVAATWAGTTFHNAGGLASPIPFDSTGTMIRVMVMSPDSGYPILLKAEDNGDATKSVETLAYTSVANSWETLYFDFSNERTGTAALNLGYTYDKLSIFYNFDVSGATAGALTFYCDNVEYYDSTSTPPPPVTSNVTFQVDMNNYTGSFTTPEVNGTFNGWCGNCNAMSDSDGDGIWDVTLPLNNGAIEFKYSHDFWAGQEALATGASCVVTNGGNTNRYLMITGDTILPPVCWESCNPCSTNPPGTYNVTFQVDMNYYTGSFTTPEVNGLFNSWCGNCAPMSDANSDGIWDITIPITSDSTEYKFSFDNWTGQESLTPGSPCTKTVGLNTNRFITLNADTILPPVCWESCDPCGGTPTSADVTFKVDMSEHTGTWSGVFLNGTFNNWCGSCAPMTDMNNDSIYEITVNVPTDSIEFKFTLDGWAVAETLAVGLPCTQTTTDATGTFTNRFLIPMNDTILPAYCWESCALCNDIGVHENLIEEVNISPNPSTGVFILSAELRTDVATRLVVYNSVGQIILERHLNAGQLNEEIDLTNYENGLYQVVLRTDNESYSTRILKM